MRKLRLKISLRNTNPLIYRIIEVPDDISFKQLHEAIQCIFDWDNAHPYEFVFEKLGIKVRKSTNYDYSNEYKIMKRRTLIGEIMEQGVTCTYIYNLSCYWSHRIECIADFKSFDHSIRISEFQGDNIPEECNGVQHYYQMLKKGESLECCKFDPVATQKLLNRFTVNGINEMAAR